MMFLNLFLALTVATSTPAAQEILNRVTDKVTQIASQLKKVYVGKIKTLGTSSIIITSGDGDHSISTNEATVFYKIRSGNRTEIAFSNLKVGDEIATVGTINSANLEMTAKQIIVKVHRFNMIGTVTENKNNVITLKEYNGVESLVDLTDAPVLKKNLGTIFQNAKLADFKVGTIAAVIAYIDPATSSLAALKAVIISP